MQIAFDPLNPAEHAWVLKALQEVPPTACSATPEQQAIAALVEPKAPEAAAPIKRTRAKKEPTAELEAIGPSAPVAAPANPVEPAKQAEPAAETKQEETPAVTIDQARSALAQFVAAKMAKGVSQEDAAAQAKAIIANIGKAARLADVPPVLLAAVLREAEAGAK